jgi:hypothetical protein
MRFRYRGDKRLRIPFVVTVAAGAMSCGGKTNDNGAPGPSGLDADSSTNRG